MNNKQQLFAQIREFTWLQNTQKDDLIKAIWSNRGKIRDLINANEEIKQEYKSGNHINWFLFLADYREYIGLPKYMDLDLFNAFCEKVMTLGENFDYDKFLKTFKKTVVKSKLPKNYKGPKVTKLIKNQGEYLAQGLVELIANAVDATSTEKNIGRFGEGFYQSLKFLKGGDSKLIVKSKKTGEKAFLLSLLEEDGENKVGIVGVTKDSIGTEIELQKFLNNTEIESLKSFVINAFKTNKKVNIFLNGEKVNKLEEYNYYNGKGPKTPTENVFIEINEKGFKVIDNGVGMNSSDLSEKLLQPTSSGKKRVNPDAMTDNELEKNTLGETAFFYKRFKNGEKEIKKDREKKDQKTQIRLQVGGVLIESFEEITSYDISEFCVELPSFTWLPESRNEIQLTREVVLSLKHTIDKVSGNIKDTKEKIMLLEIVGKIIKHLKSRESSKSSTKTKYDIDKVSKEAFKHFLSEIENDGKTVLPSILGLQKILSGNDDIVFVDPIFLNFDVRKIPGIKKLKNIKDEKVSFYKLEFNQEAEYDYLILNGVVIVNSKYTKNKADLDKINAQVNLNIGYEQGEDIVFYGVIEDDEVENGQEEKGQNLIVKDLNAGEKYVDIEIVKRFVDNLRIIIELFGDKIKTNVNKEISDVIENNYVVIDNTMYGESMRWSLEKQATFLFFKSVDGTITGGLLSSILVLSQNICEAFVKFALENSEEIINYFKIFFVAILGVENKEKYLLLIMELLNDEKNAKYIIDYIKDLENLNKNYVRKLFTEFEGDDFNEEDEKNNKKLLSTLIALKNKYGNIGYIYQLNYTESGELFGIIEIGNKDYPFIGDKIITRIGGIDFDGVNNIQVSPSGELFGTIMMGYKIYPFIGDKIKYQIGGRDFDGVSNIQLSPSGELCGIVKIGNYQYPFLGDNIKFKLSGHKVETFFGLDILHNGIFYGNCKLSGEYSQKTFIGDYLLNDINGGIYEEKNCSQPTRTFIEFLCKGGEFLAENEREILFENSGDILLTDIIGISKNFPDKIEELQMGDEKILIENLRTKIRKEIKNNTIFQRQITSTIDGQDRSAMVWIREAVQNSRDAIMKAKRNGNTSENIDDINIDFYSNNGNWVSKITDNVGMSPYEVFKYLLTPGESAKAGDETATGMFGQGFYSLLIGASEVNVKTSNGDGKTTYIKLKPIFNENKDLIDFEIYYDIKDEEFRGTIIERVDEEVGVGGNIGALVGIQNISKYVGNVDDVNIKYNGNNIYNPDDVKTLQVEEVLGLGKLTLKQNQDKKERLTKDNLFLSEIKDSYLSFFPDFLKEYIKSGGYSLDLPSGIELTKTRNAVSDFEEDIEILRPHIFNVFTRQLVKDYLDGKTKIPMMPLDYMGLDLYEVKFDKNIVQLAEKVNDGGELSLEEVQKLHDKNALVQYLICLKIDSFGEKISIRELKKRRDDKLLLKRHADNSYVVNHGAERLNTGMETGNRKILYIKDDNEKEEFLKRMQERFGKLVNRLFGCEVNFGFYQREDKDENRAVDYGFDTKGNIYFNFNAKFWEKYKRDENYKIIELVTHEFTHLIEGIVKEFGIDFEGDIINSGKNLGELAGLGGSLGYLSEINFGSHQKDLEHEHSFERIQRQVLKMMTREGL